MYCQYCGQELPNDAKYCFKCGAAVEQEEIDVETEFVQENQVPSEPKVWITFAKVGRILGIVSISICWLPLLTLSTVGIFGIVLSALGKKSRLYNHEAHVGFGLSLAGTIISIAVYMILVIIIAIIGN